MNRWVKDVGGLSLRRQAAEVCITLKVLPAAYAIFNGKVLPDWHPVSQPGECIGKGRNPANPLFQIFAFFLLTAPTPIPLIVSFSRLLYFGFHLLKV